MVAIYTNTLRIIINKKFDFNFFDDMYFWNFDDDIEKERDGVRSRYEREKERERMGDRYL